MGVDLKGQGYMKEGLIERLRLVTGFGRGMIG